MIEGPLSAAEIARFHADGYLVVKQLLSEAEVERLATIARADENMRAAAMDAKDAEGRRTNLTVWNHPSDDIYGAIARARRVVDRMEQLLGGEVYHYHSKVSAKQPRVGGKWEWHQDYGYWYDNGCLLPDMASMFLAIDRATRENGCLQLLKGSHKMGRINHGVTGGQTGADPERVEAALERFELVHCEMAPGDGVFFHGNTLHTSDANLSEHPRWGLICCYNTAANDPYKESRHPRYTPLEKLPDSAILDAGRAAPATEKRFLASRR
jgi:ectoine hydroxylase